MSFQYEEIAHVIYQDHVADSIFRIKTASSICNYGNTQFSTLSKAKGISDCNTYNCIYAEQFKHSNGKCDCLYRMTFVIAAT